MKLGEIYTSWKLVRDDQALWFSIDDRHGGRQLQPDRLTGRRWREGKKGIGGIPVGTDPIGEVT